MQNDDEFRKERGRRTPSFPLGEAIEFLVSIHNSLGDGPFSRESIGAALGYSSVSGAMTTKVGTLTHFGLLDRVSGAYRISVTAKRILFPQSEEDRTLAIIESVKAPNVYAELIQEFTSKPLPSLLANILIQRFGILSTSAADVDSVFRQSIEFAGLLRNGILFADPASPDIASVAPHAPLSQASTSEVVRPACAVEDEYRIPLTGRRSAVLMLPLPLDGSDIDRITKWLDLMRDVLTARSDD